MAFWIVGAAAVAYLIGNTKKEEEKPKEGAGPSDAKDSKHSPQPYLASAAAKPIEASAAAEEIADVSAPAAAKPAPPPLPPTPVKPAAPAAS